MAEGDAASSAESSCRAHEVPGRRATAARDDARRDGDLHGASRARHRARGRARGTTTDARESGGERASERVDAGRCDHGRGRAADATTRTR